MSMQAKHQTAQRSESEVTEPLIHSNNPQYRMCTACVMDTTDPDIVFDENGVCNYHKVYELAAPYVWKRGEEGKNALEAIAKQIKVTGKGKSYDCVVGVSGGVDSSFVLYKAVKLGLRPLPVHFDNGWNSDAAVANIESLVRKLGLELFTHVVDWKEFRDIQLSFIKASVPNLEIPTDHAIYALLYRAAAKHGIKYILSGNNYSSENTLPFAWGYHYIDSYHLKEIHRQFGSVPIKTTPLLSINNYLWHRFIKKIRNVRVLNYLDYNKETAIQLLEREFGWRRYEGKHFESRYTQFFQSYLLPKKFGYDKRKAHLSSLILSGQMTRDVALVELAKPLYDPAKIEEDLVYVSKKFGISVEELNALVARPTKKFSDYPSRYSYLCFLSKIERLIRGFSGLSKARQGKIQ